MYKDNDTECSDFPMSGDSEVRTHNVVHNSQMKTPIALLKVTGHFVKGNVSDDDISQRYSNSDGVWKL